MLRKGRVLPISGERMGVESPSFVHGEVICVPVNLDRVVFKHVLASFSGESLEHQRLGRDTLVKDPKLAARSQSCFAPNSKGM